MKVYKHTQETVNLFNNILDDYMNIKSDSALEERNISYKDYKELGGLIDCLRYRGETLTHTESIKRYFEKLGCVIVNDNNIYIAKLK